METVPENFFEKTQASTNEAFKEIDEQVEVAKVNAVPKDEFTKIAHEFMTLPHTEETRERRQFLAEEMAKVQIHFKTLAEFRYALTKVGFREPAIQDIMKHENAHASQAEIEEAELHGYSFYISKSDDEGHYSVLPQVHVTQGKEWEDGEIKERMHRIMAAPGTEEQGSYLSDNDKRQLEK
jgi:hypothetical protein